MATRCMPPRARPPPGTRPPTPAAALQVKMVQGGKKVIQFTLVDSQGQEYLAGFGEDVGHAHYRYQGMPAFQALIPFQEAHNRREVMTWWVAPRSRRALCRATAAACARLGATCMPACGVLPLMGGSACWQARRYR